jgi:hypothetical protein
VPRVRKTLRLDSKPIPTPRKPARRLATLAIVSRDGRNPQPTLAVRKAIAILLASRNRSSNSVKTADVAIAAKRGRHAQPATNVRVPDAKTFNPRTHLEQLAASWPVADATTSHRPMTISPSADRLERIARLKFWRRTAKTNARHNSTNSEPLPPCRGFAIGLTVCALGAKC